jgi:transcriptional regulator with XRE-family HTH domain
MKKSADTVLRDNLRREMGRRNLSDTDIAHRTGLSISTVRQLVGAEAGGESINLSRLQRVAEALALSPAQLLTDADSPGDGAGPAAVRTPLRGNEALPKLASRLIEEFFVLPEAERRTLVNTAIEMADQYRAQGLR